MIIGLCLFSWINYEPLKYGKIAYPAWAHGMGWLIASTSLVCIPIFAVIAGEMIPTIRKTREHQGLDKLFA